MALTVRQYGNLAGSVIVGNVKCIDVLIYSCIDLFRLKRSCKISKVNIN